MENTEQRNIYMSCMQQFFFYFSLAHQVCNCITAIKLQSDQTEQSLAGCFRPLLAIWV